MNRPGFVRGMLAAHADAAGGLCADDGSGSCAACGVALIPCGSCAGVGYHRAGCPAAEGAPEEGDHAQPEALYPCQEHDGGGCAGLHPRRRDPMAERFGADA